MLPAHLSIFWRPRPLPDGTWRLGLFCFYIRQSSRKGRLEALAVSVRGLLTAAALLSVVGYIGAALVLAHHFKQRPHNLITRTDCLLLPLRWSTIRAKQGQALIASGQDALQARRWSDALSFLASGLRRYPADLTARRQLAELRLAMRAFEPGFSLLLEGLEQPGAHSEYLLSVIKLAEDRARPDIALQAATRAEAQATRDNRGADAERAAAHSVRLLAAADQLDAALHVAARFPRPTGPVALAATDALIRAGRTDEAQALLERAKAAGGADKDWRFDQRRAHAFARPTHRAELAQTLARLATTQGKSAAFLELATVTSAKAGDDAAADRWFELFRLQYGGDIQALTKLADALFFRNDLLRVERCVLTARQHGLRTAPLWLCWLEAALIAGNRETVALATQELASLDEHTLSPLEVVLFRRARLLDAALSDPSDVAQVALGSWIEEQRLPHSFFTPMPAALASAGRHTTALRVAEAGLRLYPASPALQHARDAANTLLADRQREAQTARTVETSAVQSVHASTLLPDPAPFLEELASARTSGDWQRAIGLISAARRAKPTWLAEQEPTLGRAEIDARLARREPTELIAAIRRHLNGTAARQEEMLVLARALDAEANRELAGRVLTEIIRREATPGPATALQDLWRTEELAAVKAAAAAPASPPAPLAPAAPPAP